MPYIRHLDWLGSARLSTTWSHTVQSKVAYAPFGETYNEAGASSNDRSFTGQEQDTVTGNAATGVYDFLFRKYDPAAGRWLSPDPSGWDAVGQNDPRSMNRYAYAENNPVTLIDPNGLDCIYFNSSGVSVSSFDSEASCTFNGGNWYQGTLPDDAYIAITGSVYGISADVNFPGGDPMFGDSPGGWTIWSLHMGSADAPVGCNPSANVVCSEFYGSLGQYESMSLYPLDSSGNPVSTGGGGISPNPKWRASGIMNSAIERQNAEFNKCAANGNMLGIAEGATKTLGDDASSTKAAVNIFGAALDNQKECLSKFPLAVYSPSYRGLFGAGDLLD